MRARSDFLLPLSVVTLVLLGAWALAPVPAAAMTNEGEESPCTVEFEWFFEVGDECSEQGSGDGGGSSEEGDSSAEEGDDSGDPCADYGECWDE